MSRKVSAAVRGRYPLVAAVALVMTVVTAMGVAIAMVSAAPSR